MELYAYKVELYIYIYIYEIYEVDFPKIKPINTI